VGLTLICNPLISTFRVTGITGIFHYIWPSMLDFKEVSTNDVSNKKFRRRKPSL
jgi:hypothetical protein